MELIMGNDGPRVTVITPTFNRASLLPRVYASLVAQTRQDFESLIIDDGSQDGTKDVVTEWARHSAFPLRYAWQENSGKHVAINHGARLALGQLVLVLDPDDWLLPEAIERVLYWWNTIAEGQRERFAGVAGLCVNPTGDVIGTRFPREVLDSDSVEIRVRYRVKGDKCEVWRRDVLCRFPFPENLGRFVTEALVWNRIARQYKLRFVDEPWMVKEYQAHGLSARGLEVSAGSPRATRLYFKELIEASEGQIGLGPRLRMHASYARFSFHAAISLARQAREAPSRWLWGVAAPVGYLVYLQDLWRLRGTRRHR